MKVLSGIFDRLADVGVRGEVHDGVDTTQERLELGGVEDISGDEFEAGGEAGVAGR